MRFCLLAAGLAAVSSSAALAQRALPEIYNTACLADIGDSTVSPTTSSCDQTACVCTGSGVLSVDWTCPPANVTYCQVCCAVILYRGSWTYPGPATNYQFVAENCGFSGTQPCGTSNTTTFTTPLNNLKPNAYYKVEYQVGRYDPTQPDCTRTPTDPVGSDTFSTPCAGCPTNYNNS